MRKNHSAPECVRCTRDITMDKPCFLRNAPICVMARGGSGSGLKIEDTQELRSRKQRQEWRAENSRSKTRRLGNGNDWISRALLLGLVTLILSRSPCPTETIQTAPTTLQPSISAAHCFSLNNLILACYHSA